MELQQIISESKPGATISVPAGRYTGSFIVDKPLTLVAMGQVVLDGVHAGSVMRVETEGVVRLSGFTFVGGNAPELGGGLAVFGGEVEVSDCLFRFNKAPLYGGGGIAIADARVKLSRCRIEANTGRQGAGVLVTGTAEVVIEDSVVLQNAAIEGGGVLVKEGAKVEIVGCTIADNKVVGEQARGGALHVSGTTSRAPSLTVRQSIISERFEGPALIFNSPRLPGTVRIERSLVSPWARAEAGGDNAFGDPQFVMGGTEPYQLKETSPAVGVVDAGSVDASRRDVNGKPRVRGGKADLGAFTFAVSGNSNIGY